MSRKQNRKYSRKWDKAFIVAICLSVGLALLVIGVIVLPEPIIGAAELSKSIDFIENAADVKVVLNAPKQSGGILADAEYVMDEGASRNFTDRLYNLLKNTKYSSTEKVDTGIWKTKIVIYNATDELRIFVDSENMYLERNGRLIKYSISEDTREEYNAIYAEINGCLAS